MKYNIRICCMETYHPEKQVGNDYYIEHFKKQGKDVEHFLKDILNRDKRYVIDNVGKTDKERETSLTMQIEAAKRLLKNNNLNPEELDGIIVASQIPEYFVPPNALFIHKAIGAKRDCFAYDLNSTCIGMTMAFDQAAKYLEDDRIQKILIVGGDYLTVAAHRDDTCIHGLFGDMACAMVVEKGDGESQILDSDFFINTASLDVIHVPGCGVSKLLAKENHEPLELLSGAMECDIPEVIRRIPNMLKRNGLTLEDISGFCFSQYVWKNNKKILDELGIPYEKAPYVGNQYGYTGVNSPFLVLNELVTSQKVKRGDYLLFWTIGNSIQHIFLLIRY